MPEIITGKQNILNWCRNYLGAHSWNTIRRWKRQGLPLRYLPSNVPFVIPTEVILWAVKRDEENKKAAEAA